MQILKEKQHHPVIAQMARPDVRPTCFTICGGLFFARARCLSAGLRYLRLTRLPVTIAAPYPGRIDPRLAVYARS